MLSCTLARSHIYALTLIICLYNIFILQAQPINNYTKDVAMPAPNAAALGKFGDYTVGNFTGVPDISIPIYTVQEGPLSLPIGLSYHASGLKVAEMASWVGAGWSLNCGGIISRTVQGIKDDDANGYYNRADTLEARIIRAGPNINSNNAALNELLNEDITNNILDGEPDLFSFNVGGYSGKFYIDKAHVAQFIPRQDLKLDILITVNDATFQGFVITAPDGTRYIFGKDGNNKAQEFTNQTQPGAGSTGAYISSWYLLKIETPDKKYNISLTYADEVYSYLSGASSKFTVSISAAGGFNTKLTNSGTAGDAFHPTRRTYMTGKKLSQITSSTDVINFLSTNARNDLDDVNNANSLDKIIINTGGKCQEFDFAYTYFQDLTTPVYTFGATNSVSKKLQLNSLIQKSCDGTIANPPYIFTYQGDGSIPHRLSKAVDHWGFYNGASYNETTVGNIPFTKSGNVFYPSYGDPSINRETDEASMIKGVIKDITFPTGGKTTFTFEANTYSTTQQSLPNYVLNLANCSNPANSNCCGFTPVIGNYPITQEDLNTGRFTLQLTNTFNSAVNPPQPLCSGSDPNTHIYVFDAVTNMQVGSYGLGMTFSQANPAPIDLPISFLGSLQVGKTYRFELDVNNAYSTFKLYNQPWMPVNKKIGGLRVKQILTTDGVSAANDIIKQYDYSDINNASSSSGRLLRKPNYVYSSNSINLVSYACYLMDPSAQLIMFNDESIVPLYTFEGNHIGYNYVKEIQTGNGTNTVGNGTKLYSFSVSTPTIQGSNNPNVYPLPPLDPVVSNGQVNGLYIINSSGTTLKSTSNLMYQEQISYNIGKIRKVNKVSFPGEPTLPGAPPSQNCVIDQFAMFYTDYYIRTFPYRLTSVTETTDNVPLTTTYTYSTDATQPLFPLTTTMTNSDGKQTITTNKYITHVDYSTANTVGTDAGLVAAATSMKALNIISNPIEVTTSVNGVQVNGARTIYNLFDVPSGTPGVPACSSCFPYPYKFYKYKMSWDANGNPQVFQTNNGWDLEGTINSYDPAKVKPTTNKSSRLGKCHTNKRHRTLHLGNKRFNKNAHLQRFYLDL